jgi:hypothetical protein
MENECEGIFERRYPTSLASALSAWAASPAAGIATPVVEIPRLAAVAE